MKNKVRSKVLIFMLCLILSGMAMLGCSNGSEQMGDEPELASVSFGVMKEGSEKVISIRREALSEDNLYWNYTAEWKGDEGVPPEGAQSEQKAVKEEAGLADAELGSFTPGKWEFGLFGYSDSGRTNLVLSGKSGEVDLSAGSATPVTVPVDYNNTDGKGTIKLGTITFKKGTGYTLESITVDGGTEQITNLSDKQLTDIPAGDHTVYLKYSATDGGYYEAKVLVTVSAGVTTVIAGQLDLLVAAKPTGLTGVAPETAGESDGKITGVDSTMEYFKVVDGASWISVTGTEITSLAAGTYKVRVSGVRPGDEVVVIVPARYAVTLDKNGGSSDGSATVVHNATSLTVTKHAERTGYTLTGYWTAESGGTKVLNSDGTFAADAVTDYITGGKWTAAGDCTLYAQWTAKTNTEYKVEHYQQDVTGSGYELKDTDNKTGTTGADTEAAAKTYEGFKTPTFTQQKIAADGSTVVEIKYDRNTYTVSFNENSHGTAPSNITVRHGASITKPTDLTETGYTFGEWYKESACSTAWDFTNDTVTGNTTLYAKWTENTATLTYNANGHGTAPTAVTMKYTAETKAAAALSATGYTFNGWNTEADGSGTDYAAGAVVKAANENPTATTLYAKWTAKEYTITYLNQGGSSFAGTHASEHPTTHTYGTDTTLKGATRTGYAFGGWFTTSDCSGTAITSLEATVYTSDITLYAKWVVLPDALSGVFSVSNDNGTTITKIHFSKGNLQATIDATGVPTAWKFAENQYVCLGKDGANESIGTAGGDIDLFGWSTEATNYGISTTENASDYSGDFKDWGKAIGNGNTWRTLSEAEWMYLFKTRTVNGGKGEGKSYQIAKINSDATGGGVYGMILYPDNYTKQTGATNYSLMGWTTMEAAGCVFLPAAGNRYGSNVSLVGSDGYCWSSTAGDSGYADYLRFGLSGAYMSTSSRCYGRSVRLVCGEN